MEKETSSVARERVLAVAEHLFSERGYTAVTLRDIANVLDIRQASLYHHVPGGKEALYIEVLERGIARHKYGMQAAIDGAGPMLQTQLHAAADWLISQPPINLSRMISADMPAISVEAAQRLTMAMYAALLAPVRRCFEQAASGLRPDMPDANLLAGSFITVIGQLHDIQAFTNVSIHKLAYEIVDVLLEGVNPR